MDDYRKPGKGSGVGAAGEGTVALSPAKAPAKAEHGLGLDSAFSGIVLAVLIVGLALAIGLLPPTLAVALFVGLSLIVLVVIRIDLGLWLLAFSVPFGSIRPIGLGPLNVTVTDLLVALVLAAWLVRGLSHRQLRLPRSDMLVPLLGFFAILLLATTTAISIDACFKELLRWLELIVVYIVVSDQVRSIRQMGALVAMILVAASAEALVGFYQFLTQTGPESFIIGRFTRAYGTFNQPNPFAGYLGLALPVAISLALGSLLGVRPQLGVTGSQGASPGIAAQGEQVVRSVLSADRMSRVLTVLAWGAGGLIAVAMLMSLSRGALLGVATAVAVMAVLASRRTLGVIVIVGVVLALVMLLGAFSLLPEQIAVRFSQIVQYFGVFDARSVDLNAENWAIVERMARWQSAWEMFTNNPLLGVGPGNYVVAYESYALPNWSDPLGHAHNYYLNMLAETGLLGAGAYLAMLALWFRHGVQVVWRMKRPETPGSSPTTAAISDGYDAQASGGLMPELAQGEVVAIATKQSTLTIGNIYVTMLAVVLGLVGVLSAAAVHNFFDNLYVHDMNVQIGLTLGLLTAVGRMAKSMKVEVTGDRQP